MLATVSPEEAALPLRERKKRKTRRLIINTAIELFSARGFDAVTLEDIAAVCDVSRGTVFNYFPYKELMILDSWTPDMFDRLAEIRAGLAAGNTTDDAALAGAQRPARCGRPVADVPLHHRAGTAAPRVGTGGAAQRSLSYLPLVAEIVAAGQAGRRDPHRNRRGGTGALSDRGDARLDRAATACA